MISTSGVSYSSSWSWEVPSPQSSTHLEHSLPSISIRCRYSTGSNSLICGYWITSASYSGIISSHATSPLTDKQLLSLFSTMTGYLSSYILLKMRRTTANRLRSCTSYNGGFPASILASLITDRTQGLRASQASNSLNVMLGSMLTKETGSARIVYLLA